MGSKGMHGFQGYAWVSRVCMGFKGMQGFLPIVEYATRYDDLWRA
jgi:hypothetical protein